MESILFFQNPILTEIDFEKNLAISCCNEESDRWILVYDLNLAENKERFLFNYADDFVGGNWDVEPIEIIEWEGKEEEAEVLKFLLNFLKGG